ncbi:hypothetical protein RvY_17361 [Ramazzottius varieornatus]|uniref:Uncharacterized protein n=1 Tax=Ramazzottius varieornatus TaxID=947166 RepID=A0A1D1W2N7_RAMVA|nr:hypothetical protein RvY_17361 [Ramazzottius varieornatus]
MVDTSELQRQEKLLLALDNIPLSTSYAKIEAFFHPTALRGILKSVDYGALKATEVEIYSVADREVVLEEL